MTYCEDCRISYPGDSKICLKCGKKTTTGQAPSAPGKKARKA